MVVMREGYITNRMATVWPLVRIQVAWLAYIVLTFAHKSHAVLSPADTEQLLTLLQSTQPDLEELENDPCSLQGLAELQEVGVALTCTETDTGDNQCQRLRLDGTKHTGTLNSLSSIQFPALTEFEVHNTLLTGGLPSALVTPQLKLLAFKNNTQLRSSLPAQWGVDASGSASFPALQSLYLEDGMWEGTLPAAWGASDSFPQLLHMVITGPKEYSPTDSGLTGGVPSEWVAPGSFPSLQTLDVSHNSLAGLVPNALLGISASGTTPAARPFPSLTYAKIFQQWGSRMCAHVRSSDDIPSVPPRLDLGNESSQVTSDVLMYMKSQPGPISFTETQACDSAASADAMLRAVSRQLAEHSRDWLTAGAGQMLAATPFVVFPRDQDDIIRPKEVFIGLCDLPEMLRFVGHMAATTPVECRDALHFNVLAQNRACEATLNYCEWAGVGCAQTGPPSAHVQSIAVVAEAARHDLPEGIGAVASPLPKRNESLFTYLPEFSRDGVLPDLESMALGTGVWGVLPESWSMGKRFRSLQAVHLLGDNFIHATAPGWFTKSPEGMQLQTLTVATATTVGCLPTSLLSGAPWSLTSLELVPAPSADQFPSTQHAVAHPLAPFLGDQMEAGASSTADPYSAIKQMHLFKIPATRSVVDLAFLGCSTDGSGCPVEASASGAACNVQLQQLELAEGNMCGEGYLPTGLGCPWCGQAGVGGCEGSCEAPPEQSLCRWRSNACSEEMQQASLRREAFTLTVPAAARDMASGVYVLALSAALAAGGEVVDSPMVGRPRVRGLVVTSSTPDCQAGGRVAAASMASMLQELLNSELLTDALMRPSLLLSPVEWGAAESMWSDSQLRQGEAALWCPPDVPATHVLVEVDRMECVGAGCITGGRKLLRSDDPRQGLLQQILRHPITASVFMQSVQELSAPVSLQNRNLRSVDGHSTTDLLPHQRRSDRQGEQERGESTPSTPVSAGGVAGVMAMLAGVLCCGFTCCQRTITSQQHQSADRYVEISESPAPSYTNGEGHNPAHPTVQAPREAPGLDENTRSKMQWLKGLAGTRRTQGSSRDRATWSKFDHLLSIMTCASRLPADVTPEDAAVVPRPTPPEMVSTGVKESFTEIPPKAHVITGADHAGPSGPSKQSSTAVLNPQAVAREMVANREALSALVLRGTDAKKHAALRVASAHDSLFAGDPFGIYRTSPFQTPLWEMLLSHRREGGAFKEHMLPARRFHCVGKGGFDSGVAELQELQKNRLAVIHEFRLLTSGDPTVGLKLQRASTSGIPRSASSARPGTPLAHVEEEKTSDNSHGEGDSTKAGSLQMSPQISAVPGGLTSAATVPAGRLPSASLGSGGLPSHRALSATPPVKVPRHIILGNGESGPLSEDKVNQRERQYIDIIGQGSFPGQLPRPGSASLPSGSTPEFPGTSFPDRLSVTDDPLSVTHDSVTDAPDLHRVGESAQAMKGYSVSAPLSRSFSWPYCQSLASMDFQALARNEDGFLRTTGAFKNNGECLDNCMFLGTDPRHPTVLLGSVYFVGDRQKARLNREAENANAPYKPPDRVMGAPQPSAELPAAVTAAVAAASSRRIAARTGQLRGATDRVAAEMSGDTSRLAQTAASEWRQGDSQSSLTTPPSRSATVQGGATGGFTGGGTGGATAGRDRTDDQVTSHTGLLEKLSNAFASREQTGNEQQQVYIPPDDLDHDTTSAVQSSAGPSARVQPQDDAALIQQALHMCDTDKLRESLGTPGGAAWGAAPGATRGSSGAAPPGAGGYMKLEDIMNGTLPSEPGGTYPASGGPQAAIEPPDKVSVRYDQHSEAGIDTAFNVLLECFGMMQWQGPAKEIAVSMLEDLKSHVSAHNENRSIFDNEKLDLADLDMTSFRADEELGKDIIEPPAAQAEDRNKNAHLGLGLGKLTPLREDSESDEEASGQVVARTGAEVALPPSMPPQPDRDMCIDPKKLNYISLLGRGAFGEVHYGAWEAPDGQVHDVAIKVLLATRYGSLQECDKDRKKFVTEMQLMMRMTHHSIVRCFGGAMARHDGENDFMVLEYIPGGTLDHYVHEHRRESRLTLGEVLVIATDLADVLRYLHKLGVVHQDLKPSNILLNEHGEVKLTDFGISKIKRSTCLSQCMVGTPSYTAPEVWVGDQVNEKCDIFALGILLWECMTGTRPFKNMHAFQIMMHLQTNQKRGEDWLPFPKATPPEFKRLVRRCWHAENRFRISADEALASAVLLRSTIHDATQSAPVELDVGLLPENHSQGVLIPSNRMSRRRKRTDPSASGARDYGRSMKPDRMYTQADTRANVYVPSSPTGSRGASRTILKPKGHESPSGTDSMLRPQQSSMQPPSSPAAEMGGGQSTGEASWAADWSLHDPNSKAIQPMWNIGFGGDTTSNLGQGSTFAVGPGSGLDSAMSGVSGGGHGYRSGASNARIKQPASTSSAQGRSAGPSRMPAVLETDQQHSAGSKELETTSGAAPAAAGADTAHAGPSVASEADARQGRSSKASLEMARLATPSEPSVSKTRPALNGSGKATSSQARAAERLPPGFTASRAKSPQKGESSHTVEEDFLTLKSPPKWPPMPSAHQTYQSTAHITNSTVLPASGQLSHTRQLSRPFPPAPTEDNTEVTVGTLAPSEINENSRQALPSIPGPSLADAWKVANRGAQFD